mgnify:CR=1 FL=1
MRAGPVLLYVVGVAIFCAMDSAMKKLVETNPAVMATFWRYLAAAVFAIPFWLRAGRPRVTADMLPVHLLRGVVLAASAYLAGHPALADPPCRFDVIEGSGDASSPRLHWIRDAFRADEC